jgi:predicted amidohydrolase YtcJ
MKKLFVIIMLLTNITFSQDEKAGLAIINGKVWTVDKKMPSAQAIAIKDDKIIFVGSNDEVKKLTDKNTRIIDAEGKLILPGFIDDHTHFSYGGSQLLGINLRDAATEEEFAKRIKEYADKYPGKWITGGDWDHELWTGANLPYKELIDKYTPNTPVFVSRFDGHMALANSCALKIAGIDKSTPSQKGGTIVKDPKTGEPTGILKDEAMGLVNIKIPNATREEKTKYIEEALNHAATLGITSIQDVSSLEDVSIYRELEKTGKLTLRLYCRIPIEQYKTLLTQKTIIDKESNSFIKMGVLKAFADGSVGSSTALFFEPYLQDTTTRGLAMEMLQNGELEKLSIECDKNKYQISIHAIGDSANSAVLDIFEKIVKENPSWDRRFRIEHAQHLHPKDFKRYKDLNVIASAQPYHCIDDGCWVIKRIGKERCKTTYAFKTFLENGITLCFGSDWTVAPLSIVEGIYAAVTRRTLDNKNPDGWFPEQKISVEDAIKCYTINNAYASFEENIKGSITPGKLADLVMLEKDILTIDPVKIRDAAVSMTMVGGKIVYTKK